MTTRLVPAPVPAQIGAWLATVTHMRTTHRRSLAALVAMVLLAGCSDAPAPTAIATLAKSPYANVNGTAYVTTFTVAPDAPTTFFDGATSVSFPAGAICDPATSTYGPGEWDQPCAPATEPITFTVVATVKGNRVNLDFSPSVRFVPGREVTLVTRNEKLKSWTGKAEPWAVFYNAGDDKLVDESKNDRSLITWLDRPNGTITRRIKHFTGYNFQTGQIEDCTPYVDPYCIPIDGGAQDRPPG